MSGPTPPSESQIPAGKSPLTVWPPGLSRWTGRFLFAACRQDPEQGRQARLIIGFGFLGFCFGLGYAAFYFGIRHFWGAGIVVVCSLAFAAAPFVMRARQELRLAGHLLVGVMLAGFLALCCVEGGLSGHALAWLASVPLCALLLIGKQAAKIWLGLCFLSSGSVVTLALTGVKLPVTYDPAWEPVVSAVGYLGLIVFMCILGLIFETSREQAQAKMREALAQLEASNQQLVHLNNEKNEFLGIAAHDLKNPLTTIILGADVMQATGPAPHHESAIRGIISAGTRMRDLITQLLDANAIEEGRYISQMERCDLAALAAEGAAHNRAAADRKQIELLLELPGELPVRADRKAVVQILDNLVSNAVKYSPPQTVVRIRGLREAGQCGVAVADQGPGLSAEDQKKLFGKFVRLSAKPTGGESSNGLGLSIVKKLAEAMQGSVRCESQLGAGATFSVRLPEWSENSPPPAP